MTDPAVKFSLSSEFPSGWCFGTWQQHAVELIKHLTGYLPGDFSGIIVSDVTPDADNRDKLWVKLSAGAPVKQYYYFNGDWVWPHAEPASSNARKIWVGNAASLVTYDGGDADAAGDASGPMWEVDTNFEARTLLGVGTLPVSSTVLAVGDEGGIEKHVLTGLETPVKEHYHQGGIPVESVDSAYHWFGADADGTTKNAAQSGAVGSQKARTSAASDSDADAHENLPPYRAVHIVKRSSRIYYTA